MKKLLKTLTIIIFGFMLLSNSQRKMCYAAQTNEFAKGADVSWTLGMEQQGYIWKNINGINKDILSILKDDYGINAIRLRVFVNPSNDYYNGWCDKEKTITMAKRANALGLDILLDFHYSDSWADPGQQNKPSQWENYTFNELMTAVYNHTYDVMNGLAQENIYPKWVQVGNETNNGMLWNDGKASENMSNFALLINCGYNAVKQVSPNSKVIVHLSNANEIEMYEWMFDGLINNGANFDVVGMSIYPEVSNWIENNNDVFQNMLNVIEKYNKEIMVCEAGMSYQADEESKKFLTDTIDMVKSLPNSKGLGVFYWEPQCYPGYNGYDKGAWNSDGKPTKALEGFWEHGNNLITNSEFISSSGTGSLNGWTIWTDNNEDAVKTEYNGLIDDYKLTHWKNSNYKASTYQTITNLEDGYYTLKAWTKCSGGQNTVQLYAKNFGSTELNQTLPTTNEWQKVIISNIHVTNGQCEVGIWSDANAGNWCNIDKIELYKNN